MHHKACVPRRDGPGCIPIRALKPRSLSWRGWTESMAECLRLIGAGKRAESRASCGRWAWTVDCTGCGKQAAVIIARAECDGRTCALCARADSKARAAEIERALAEVPKIADQRAVETIERLAAAADSDEWLAFRWRVRAATWSLDARPRALGYADDAIRRAKRSRSWIAAIKRRRSWRTRFVTLTRWFDPSDVASWSVDAMRTRVVELFAQWSAVWADWASVDSMAAATAHIEISDMGHVHLHVVYWGPWIAHRMAETDGPREASWLERTQAKEVALAGFSHVREADSDVVTELAKYTAKLPTPSGPGWLAGERRTVLNPRIAAAWEVALHRVQVWRHFGTMREAIERTPAPEFEGFKCQCGHIVGVDFNSTVAIANHGHTAAIARAALDRHREVVRAWEVIAWDERGRLKITAPPKPEWNLRVAR